MGVWNTDTIRPQSLEGLLKKTSVLTLLKAVEDEAVENVRKQKHLSWEGEKSFYTLLFWDRILLWIPHWPWTWVNSASVFQGLAVFKCIKCYRWLQFLSFFPPPSYLSLNISCIPGLPQAYCYSSGWPSTSDLPATISQVLEFQVCVPYQVGVLQGIKPKASICQVQSWVPQTLGRQRQEDQEFNANLSYIMSLRLGWGMWTLCPNQNPKNPPTIIPVYSV